MTWLQLQDTIRSMSHEERLQPVRFYDSYSDEPALIEVVVAYAKEEIVVPIDGEEPAVIKKGEPFLY